MHTVKLNLLLLMKYVTGISRLLVGLLFIFSGFIKANDPIGFSYKLVEYYGVFGTTFLNSTAVWQAIFICVFEIALGFAVLIGTRMNLSAWLLLLMIVFFTFLTGFTAISNWFVENKDAALTLRFENLLGFKASNLYYMKDCGCFGDAIKLTPWQSFFKDLILLVLITLIFVRRKHIKPFFAKIMQTNLILFFTLMSLSFSLYCYFYLPYINFLPVEEGRDIAPLTKSKPPVVEMIFIYEKAGQQYTFTLDNLPNNISEYKMVTRIDSVIVPEVKAQINDFYLTGSDGNSYEQEVLEEDGYKLLIVAPYLNKTNKNAWKKISTLSKEFQQKGYKIYAISSASKEEAESFRHEYQLDFPMCFMDPTAAKGLIRSNPGIILLRKSTVVRRYPSRSIPNMQRIEKRIAKFEKKNPG